MVEQRRCAVVTGGANGIGAGIVRRLAADGYRVAIFDRDRAAGSAIATELKDQAGFFAVDIGDETSIENAVAIVLELTGRIDALVNNAGIADPVTGPIESLSLARWNEIIATNLTGYFCALSMPLRICVGMRAPRS